VSGIEDIRIHDLRHERATTWAQQGVPLAVVAKIAGHKDVRTTLRVYQDVVEQDVFDVFNGENTHAALGGTTRHTAEPAHVKRAISSAGASDACCVVLPFERITPSLANDTGHTPDPPGHPDSTE
jgi:hypothetical protein